MAATSIAISNASTIHSDGADAHVYFRIKKQAKRPATSANTIIIGIETKMIFIIIYKFEEPKSVVLLQFFNFISFKK